MTTAQFIEVYASPFIEACAGTTLFPSVKGAQGILESGSGNHTIGPAKNLFGIKKGSTTKTPYWDGSVYRASTGEFLNGKNVTISNINPKERTFLNHFKYNQDANIRNQQKKCLNGLPPLL